MLAVIERLMGMMSGRQHDRFKMSPEFRENIHALLGDGDESAPLPHSSSIEYTFRSLSVDCIRTGIEKMVRRLLRGKRLECMRTAIPQHGKQYYRVAIDAVHFNTSTRPIGHAVHKKRADGTVEYLQTCLVASLVAPGMRIPFMFEFIENEGEDGRRDVTTEKQDGEHDKQDCELKAAKRLIPRLAELFGNYRLFLLLDGLYLCDDILAACSRNNWEVSMTVTDKTSAFLAKAREAMEKNRHARWTDTDPVNKCPRNVSWCRLKYRFGEHDYRLSVIEYRWTDKDGKENVGVYATGIFLHDYQKEVTIYVLDNICRIRWQIEELFKVQKHHGLSLEANFGTRGNTGLNFFLVVQMAAVIRTVITHSSLFRRLQQMQNPNKIRVVIQRPMMEWYKTLENLASRIQSAMLRLKMNRIDMTGWRISFNTA